MSAQRKTSAPQIYELSEVPADKVAQVVDDFLSEGPATVEKDLQSNGTYTVRVRRLGPGGSVEPLRK